MRVRVVVDAENVRRSIWPNVPRDALPALCAGWAERKDVDVLVVFDGDVPTRGVAEGVVLAGSGGRSADDLIVETVEASEQEIWLVTSDRALRHRVGGRVARRVGGGAFVREILGR